MKYQYYQNGHPLEPPRYVEAAFNNNPGLIEIRNIYGDSHTVVYNRERIVPSIEDYKEALLEIITKYDNEGFQDQDGWIKVLENVRWLL